MVRSRAPYMEWAEVAAESARSTSPESNLLACTLDDLPGAREASRHRRRRARTATRRSSKRSRRATASAADRVATAGGCSGANFLAFAALLDTGDEVSDRASRATTLSSRPRGCSARGSASSRRRFEEGYALDTAAVAARPDREDPARRSLEPPQPFRRPAPDRRSIAGLGRVAEKAGVHVLVDEVYLDACFGGKQPPAATLSPAFHLRRTA